MSDTPDPVAETTLVEDAKVLDTTSEPVSTTSKPKRRSVVVPMVVGGVLAAAVGFGMAQVVPQGWPLAQVSGLSADVKAQAATIAALDAKVAELASRPAAKIDPAVFDRLAALEATVANMPAPADLTGRLDAVEQRLASLASLPAGSADGAAVAQLQAQIDALKSGGTALDTKVAEAASELESIKAEAQTVVTQAAARAALHQLQAALDSGAPYGSALADLKGAALPEVLTAHADTGLPSLQTLREEFPAAARAALQASLKATTETSWTDRVGTFLRGQTGARSLTPRAGTDPDAVLSRAEAAVAAGDLAAALTELAGLPDAGKAAMADWLGKAQQRQDAAAAVQALSTSVGQ